MRQKRGEQNFDLGNNFAKRIWEHKNSGEKRKRKEKIIKKTKKKILEKNSVAEWGSIK